MESEELRELTASERLSLEAEFEMQEKWRNDSDKCTFIILDKEIYDKNTAHDRQGKEIDAMVGDVNIFFQEEDKSRSEGEVEIMIAEPKARGKGFGREALCSMMKYAQAELKTHKFVCKIGCSNTASLHLFQSLGFIEVSRSDVFNEVTLKLDASDQSTFNKWTPAYSVESIADL